MTRDTGVSLVDMRANEHAYMDMGVQQVVVAH